MPAGVAPGQRVPANDEHIGEHLQTVAQHAHFRSRRMRPTHRYFRRMQPMMPSQVQQFRIEAKALDALLLKNYFARFALESFEPALGVYKRKSQTKTYDGIEHNAGE